MPDEMSGWMQLTHPQQEAAKAAAAAIEGEGMRFLLLLFGEHQRGAIIGNIEPAEAVKLIEAALAAARAMIAGHGRVEEIAKATLQ